MTEYFHLSDDQSTGAEYDLTIAPQWRMPGLHCENCGRWRANGLFRPDLSVANDILKVRPLPIALAEHRSLASKVGAELQPGTWIGPPTGVIRVRKGVRKGVLPNIVWKGNVMPLFSSRVLRQLQSVGLPPAYLCHIEGAKESYSCLDLPLAGDLSSESFEGRNDPCTICGRVAITLAGELTMLSTTIPPSPIFRLRELPTYVVATKEFTALVAEHSITGLRMTEIRRAA